MQTGYYVAMGTVETLKNRHLLSGTFGSTDAGSLVANTDIFIGTLKNIIPAYAVMVPVTLQYGGVVKTTGALKIDTDGKIYINSPVDMPNYIVSSFVAVVYAN